MRSALFLSVLSLLTPLTSLADPVLPAGVTSGENRLLPGQEIDEASAGKFLKEKKDLQHELLLERSEVLKSMAGKTETERAQMFLDLGEKQRSKVERIREINAKTRKHAKDKAEKALKERGVGKNG